MGIDWPVKGLWRYGASGIVARNSGCDLGTGLRQQSTGTPRVVSSPGLHGQHEGNGKHQFKGLSRTFGLGCKYKASLHQGFKSGRRTVDGHATTRLREANHQLKRFLAETRGLLELRQHQQHPRYLGRNINSLGRIDR